MWLFIATFSASCIAIVQSGSRKTTTKKKPPCVKNFEDCGDEGCGGQFDPNLNRVKNIRSLDGEAKLKTLASMKKLDDPENFSQGDSREELEELGEGQKITVVAYLLTAKPELGASRVTVDFTRLPRRTIIWFWFRRPPWINFQEAAPRFPSVSHSRKRRNYTTSAEGRTSEFHP